MCTTAEQVFYMSMVFIIIIFIHHTINKILMCICREISGVLVGKIVGHNQEIAKI